MWREKLLYRVMLVGAMSWCGALIVAAAFATSGPVWIMWANIFLIAIAATSLLATLVLSVLVVVAGPRPARLAVLKFLLLFVPSVGLLSHLVPIWVPIAFALALALLSAKWVADQGSTIGQNVHE